MRVSPVGLPSSSSTGASIGTTSRVEAALAPRLDRELLAAQAEAVGVLARDAVLLGDHLGALELRREGVVLRGSSSAAGEPPVMFEPSGTRVIISTPQASTRSSMPAPIRPAASVVACWLEPHWLSIVVAGDLDRQALREPGGARDVEGLLAHLRDAAADDLADRAGIDPGALDRGALHGAEQIGRMQPRETALAAADRGTHGVDDEDFLHGRGFARSSRRVKPATALPPA